MIMNSAQMWVDVQTLRSIQGTNAKKAFLQRIMNDDWKMVLRHTYDPFKQYNFKPSASLIGTGIQELNTESLCILTALYDGTLSGNRAKSRIKEHCNSLDYSSCELFKCILNKSLDIGLAAKSINDVRPGLIPEHAIQLAKPIDWKRVKYPVWASVKLDGLRAVFKDGKFFSRKGHVLQGLTALAAVCQEFAQGFTLDGELIIPGEHFNEASGQLRSFNETPDAVYGVFDVVDFNQCFLWRYNKLTDLHLAYKDNPPYRILPVLHKLFYTREEVEAYYEKSRVNGYEGLVVKNSDGMYENARTWAWMKMKNTETADCKVTGIFPGQGKYEGLVGGIYVDYNGTRVGVGSGLTDFQRNIWADSPEEIIGSVVEIAFQEVTPDGSLRHPRLIRVRGDL